MFLEQEGLATTVTIVAHKHPFVIEVDTHARTHVLAILTVTGQQVDSAQFPTNKAGMACVLTWVARRTDGDLAALWVNRGHRHLLRPAHPGCGWGRIRGPEGAADEHPRPP